MREAEAQKIFLRNEIARLGCIVEAARLTERNVSLQRALIVRHACDLAELEIASPAEGPSTPQRSSACGEANRLTVP
jgi:hypothetical protein